MNNNFLIKEIRKLIDASIQKYVSTYLETVYYGVVTNIASTPPIVDIGITKVSAVNLTGGDLSVNDKVIVKAIGDRFNNAYIDKKF